MKVVFEDWKAANTLFIICAEYLCIRIFPEKHIYQLFQLEFGFESVYWFHQALPR